LKPGGGLNRLKIEGSFLVALDMKEAS
jgi:hypothetical protein